MSSYHEVLNQALSLPPDEQLRLISELLADVRHRVIPKPQHRITELRGLGKEIGNGIDAQEYVERERASWNG
jgi:hypothetical protein